MIEAPLTHAVERFDQPLEVLVRLHVAGVQHELVVELIALAHADHVLFARLDAEPLVVRVVDDIDLVGVGIDESQDVALGTLRHRQHARRTVRREADRHARVAEREMVRQVLRKHQVNAVVDRHDRSTGNERGQHVMRRVEERHALAAQRERDAHLLGDRVVAGRLGDGAKITAERVQRLAVLLAAQHDELGVSVEAREVP